MAKATLREIPALIAKREAFEGNSMKAEVHPAVVFAGKLNDSERAVLNAENPYDIVYVVYSYETPIAWVRRDGSTYTVKQRFSVTTSKHQGKLYTL